MQSRTYASGGVSPFGGPLPVSTILFPLSVRGRPCHMIVVDSQALSYSLIASFPARGGIAFPHPGTELVLGSAVRSAVEPDESEDDPSDDEDLTVPTVPDDESSFDDFDDDFDDDFEEEDNDPDWDHPDDGDQSPPPPAKGPGKRK